MKIGIAQIDGLWANLALMKLSAWHKANGDTVSVANGLERYDKVYASKVFNFSPDWESYPIADEIIRGGSGFDIKLELPYEVEHIMPDYGLFNVDRAMGFSTRGCLRSCHFCIVPNKEGKIRRHAHISEFWNGQKELVLLDNNLTAMPDVLAEDCAFIREHKLKVDFSQGLDARLMTDEMAREIGSVRHIGQIHFAFDSIAVEKPVLRGLSLVRQYVNSHRITCFVLIGFDTSPEEDLYRVMKLHELGYESFVMPFNKKDEYQRRFARWCNHKAIFKTVKWEDYK